MTTFVWASPLRDRSRSPFAHITHKVPLRMCTTIDSSSQELPIEFPGTEEQMGKYIRERTHPPVSWSKEADLNIPQMDGRILQIISGWRISKLNCDAHFSYPGSKQIDLLVLAQKMA